MGFTCRTPLAREFPQAEATDTAFHGSKIKCS
jgi:hypothetical protein